MRDAEAARLAELALHNGDVSDAQIQTLESNILIPMLMKEGMDLPPVLTILAQALMAVVFGFLGLLVAVPVLAAVMVPIKMLYVEGVVGDDLDLDDEDDDND